MRSGALGTIVDFEVRVNVDTAWDDWPFLAGIPRHEVLYHSVHYLDLAGRCSACRAACSRRPDARRTMEMREKCYGGETG